MIARQYRRLLDPVDRNELSLPDDVLDARATLARMTAALAGLTPPRPAADVFDDAVNTTLQAADPAAVDLSEVLDHNTLAAAHDARVGVLQRALDIAGQDFTSSIVDNSDEIITDHIAPAGAGLWEEITAAVKAIGNVETSSSDALLRAPDRTRKAWLQLDSLAVRYSRLRAALGDIPTAEPRHDTAGDHAEFHAGLCTVVGHGWRTTPTSPAPRMPWPGDPRGRLVWLVRNGAVPWWPTPTERDTAWMDAHREAHDHQQQRNAAHRQVHGWGGAAA